MNKGKITQALRQLRLMHLTDRLRYHVQRWKNRRLNREFRQQHPGVKLPPDYLIYESFQIHYPKYYLGGRETAGWLAGYFRKYVSLHGQNVLDWGCGPGRVIRHLPEVIGNGCQYYGTDYNARSISWCRENLPGIQFNLNTLEARLPWENDFFDVIYGISIFTHLSEALHTAWYRELYRILRPGGILFLTTQGDAFQVKLTGPEQAQYRRGELVVRGKVMEGHRIYSAFHPLPFMHSLFAGAEILEHVPSAEEPGKGISQDIWIVRKPLA